MTDKPIIICPTCESELIWADKPIGASKPEMMLKAALTPIQPSNGDMNICNKCNSLSIFTTGNGKIELRLPTEEEKQIFIKHFS